MADKDTWLRPVGDPERGLYVELREHFSHPYKEGKPQLAIMRQGGGLVTIDLDEARDLCAVIAEAAADLAAEQAKGGD